MQKIRLHFTLVGKTDAWRRRMKQEDVSRYMVSDDLAYVNDTVANQFGGRTTVMANEKALSHWTSCPKFYSAVWFVDDEAHQSDLVIIGYGSTMEDANEVMMDYVQKIDWNKLAVKIQ